MSEVIEFVQMHDGVKSGIIKEPGTLTDSERDALLQHLVLQVNAVAAWQSDLTVIVGKVMAGAKDNPMFAMMMPDGL